MGLRSRSDNDGLYLIVATMLTDDDFHRILDHFDRPWAGYRKVRKGVKKRIRRHMDALAVTSASEYLRILAQNRQECEICRECLLVTISRFFRDRKLWLHLRERLLPELIERFPAGIRVWSAGCACGEEVYSLVLLWEILQPGVPLEILATDVNPDNLERARTGVYERTSLREVSEEIRDRYFIVCSTGRLYGIRPQFKNQIRWRRHELFSPPPDDGPFHLLLLRNSLLTYHRGEAMEAAFSRLVRTMAPRGCLIVGSHEHPPATHHPLVVDPHCPWVYRLQPAGAAL